MLYKYFICKIYRTKKNYQAFQTNSLREIYKSNVKLLEMLLIKNTVIVIFKKNNHL